jgi:fructose-1,6-bisphosphatase/inositol monophosphatase family enzyme
MVIPVITRIGAAPHSVYLKIRRTRSESLKALPSMPDPELVARLIRDSSRRFIIPRYRNLQAGEIREKKPGDFVTIADLEMEQGLTPALAALLPGAAVVGEEASAEDPAMLSRLGEKGPVWVVDPIDGTGNFRQGLPGFGVIVALVADGCIEMGWLYEPLRDRMVTAVRGGGAWHEGERLRVRQGVAAAELVGSAYGRAAGGGRAGQVLAASGRIGAVENLGCSALEYMAIAVGKAHFSLHSRSLPWDHAAGMLAVAEAGGVARFLDGGRYDPRISDRAVLAAIDEPAFAAVRDTVTLAQPAAS